MAVYRLAVKGFDSNSLLGSRSGNVIAVYPFKQDFGSKGEKDFSGIVVDLPGGHPLAGSDEGMH